MLDHVLSACLARSAGSSLRRYLLLPRLGSHIGWGIGLLRAMPGRVDGLGRSALFGGVGYAW